VLGDHPPGGVDHPVAVGQRGPSRRWAGSPVGRGEQYPEIGLFSSPAARW
jgi:hypothetical protein